jgi:LuxR family maltose regulon positive regulatory protein
VVLGSLERPGDVGQESATTATVPEPRIRKHRIVERPRLFALLDESNAQVRMLIAPAGYGKTTLAEQWVGREGREGIWYTARSASTDVAALALGIARAATAIVDDSDHRLREHLRALPAPAENVQTLAEILSEDLAEWPTNAWLVLDDYHEITPEPKAEDFVDALVALSPVQLLIASRVRPRWVASKDVMYGDVLEIGQRSLAMDNLEAASVLVDRTERSTSGLVSLANGWPAVIGIASASTAEVMAGGQVPESLYGFFADEVFGALDADVQQGLTTLAVAPLLDHELASSLLGACTDRVLPAALDVGLLVERGVRLELHPLARVFLEERTAQLGLAPDGDAARKCLALYCRTHEWDAAFELVARGAAGRFDELLALAMDELLETARLSTVRRWSDYALEVGLDSPLLALARAELALRHGRHAEAIAHAELAAARDDGLRFRALVLAGRAAHLASREEEALTAYERAEAAAQSETEIQDAKWGQLMCAIELESPHAEQWLGELNAAVPPGEPRGLVRSAAIGLSCQVKLGDLDLSDADNVATLVPFVDDPLVVSAFQSTYSAMLGLVGRYSEAQRIARAFLDTIQKYRLDFALTYALCAESVACAGLRDWARAESTARMALDIASIARDGHAQQLCIAQLTRVLTQQGRQREALDLELPSLRAPLPSVQAEVVSTRSLALASASQLEEARRLVGTVEGLSHAVEPAVLISATRAVCALKQHEENAVERVNELAETAIRRGAVDLLVTAYRSTPELLPVLFRASPHGDAIRSLVKRAGDEDLAELLGYPVSAVADARQRLTPRERDVYDLMIQGLKNREIARLLFIEESTVKVHAQHIFDKLGVRSRTALMVHAILERSDQATSATDSSPPDVDST